VGHDEFWCNPIQGETVREQNSGLPLQTRWMGMPTIDLIDLPEHRTFNIYSLSSSRPRWRLCEVRGSSWTEGQVAVDRPDSQQKTILSLQNLWWCHALTDQRATLSFLLEIQTYCILLNTPGYTRLNSSVRSCVLGRLEVHADVLFLVVYDPASARDRQVSRRYGVPRACLPACHPGACSEWYST